MRRWAWIWLPLAFFVTCAGWALASPVGAAPDDDYHLASIWCAQGEREGVCVRPGCRAGHPARPGPGGAVGGLLRVQGGRHRGLPGRGAHLDGARRHAAHQPDRRPVPGRATTRRCRCSSGPTWSARSPSCAWSTRCWRRSCSPPCCASCLPASLLPPRSPSSSPSCRSGCRWSRPRTRARGRSSASARSGRSPSRSCAGRRSRDRRGILIAAAMVVAAGMAIAARVDSAAYVAITAVVVVTLAGWRASLAAPVAAGPRGGARPSPVPSPT